MITRILVAQALAVGLIMLVFAAALWSQPVRAAGCQPMVASHYGSESGSRTANGERFNGTSMTAAHKTLPFGTRLQVTYQGKSVVVRINDRGPAKWTKRDLDLSTAAANVIGMTRAGVARVCVQRL